MVNQRRFNNERRQPLERRGLSPLAQACQDACRNVGVIFLGIQPGFGDIPALCLFSENERSTCLAIPAHATNPTLIRAKLGIAEQIAARIERKQPFEIWFPSTTAAKRAHVG